MGFSIPLAKWLRGPLKEKLVAALNAEVFVKQNIFDTDKVNKLINEHMSGRNDHGAALWTLYMLALFIIQEFDA